MGDARDVLLQLLVDIDLLNRLLAGEQLVGRGHWLELVDGRRALEAIEHLNFVGDIQIAEVDAVIAFAAERVAQVVLRLADRVFR